MYSNGRIHRVLSSPSLAAKKLGETLKRQIRRRKHHDYGVQGSYETGNVGDLALGKQMEQQIQAAGYSVELFGRTTTDSNTTDRILGGGGVLHDWYGVDHLKRRLKYVNGGERGYIIGAGAPGFRSPEACALVSEVLPRMEKITVRDQWSKENIRSACDVDVTVTACPAFLYEDPDVRGTGKTGINFRPYFDQPDKTAAVLREYFGYDDLERANARYIENAKKICAAIDDPVFIPFHHKDERFAEQHLDIPVRTYDFSVQTTLERVSEVDRMVATRYHSLVFAAICGKPVLTVAYEPKVESLAERLSVPPYKPHRKVPVDFHPVSNVDRIRRKSRKNFSFLRDV